MSIRACTDLQPITLGRFTGTLIIGSVATGLESYMALTELPDIDCPLI